MTVVVSAAAPAPVAAPAVAHGHSPENGHHGFSAELDALTAGEGKAKSTGEGDRHTGDDAADAASARPSADLRAALMGGAFASLSMTSKAVADAASLASSARTTAPSLLEQVPVLTRPRLPLARPAGPRRGRNPSPGRRLRPSALISLRRPLLPRLRTRPLLRRPKSGCGRRLFRPLARRRPGSGSQGSLRRRRMQRQSRRLLSPPPPPPPPKRARPQSRRHRPRAWRLLARPPSHPIEPRARLPGPRPRCPRSRPQARPRSSRRSRPQRPHLRVPPGLSCTPRRTAHASGAGSAAHAASAETTAEVKTEARQAANPAAGGQGATSPLQGAASTNLFGAASVLAAPAQGGAASSTPLGLVGGVRCADERASGCGFHRPARP